MPQGNLKTWAKDAVVIGSTLSGIYLSLAQMVEEAQIPDVDFLVANNLNLIDFIRRHLETIGLQSIDIEAIKKGAREIDGKPLHIVASDAAECEGFDDLNSALMRRAMECAAIRRMLPEIKHPTYEQQKWLKEVEKFCVACTNEYSDYQKRLVKLNEAAKARRWRDYQKTTMPPPTFTNGVKQGLLFLVAIVAATVVIWGLGFLVWMDTQPFSFTGGYVALSVGAVLGILLPLKK